MRFAAFATIAALVSSAVATSELTTRNVSPNPYPMSSLSKRSICIFGVCVGTTAVDYSSDVNNCGSAKNVCKALWLPYGQGTQCSNGVCGPATLTKLYDFNWSTLKVISVASDLNNWYAESCILTPSRCC